MIRTVGIVSRPRREEVAQVVPPLVDWLRAKGAEVLCDSETTGCIGTLSAQARQREELPALSDLLIVLGGDGTLLSAARLAAQRKVPILPVNLGGLGFLTTVAQDEMYPILEAVFSGKYRVSERAMIEAEVIRDGVAVRRQIALNDAVLNKAPLARMMDVEVHVNGEYVTTYRADGLILSTPTGSTAYSLAAGGPIVYPRVEAFLITPICPHTLTHRPLVVPDSAVMEVDFKAYDEGAVILTLDGQVGIDLMPGDHIVVHKTQEKLRLVRAEKKSYFQILRRKMKWGER